MTDPRTIRKQEDLAKLRSLQEKTRSRIEVTSVDGNPPRTIRCRIHIPTAADASFPRKRQEVSEVQIDLPSGYPLEPPLVNFRTPIWNPNVYMSGRWCFGDWKVTENLELFAIRLMKVIALDPTIVNPQSAANSGAATWYVDLRKSTPGIFPTVAVNDLLTEPEKPKMTWKTIK